MWELIDHSWDQRNYTDGTIQAYANSYVYFWGNGLSDDNTALIWNWDFGDGTTSNDQYPSHIYSAPGNYIVKLTVTDGSGEKAVQETATIVAAPSFSASPASGNKPLKVQFKDTTSAGTTYDWNWDFGDGTYSDVKNPVHVYNTVGNYTVTLEVDSSEYGSGQATGYVSVTELPNAVLYGAPTTVTAGQSSVQFNSYNSTGNPTSWKWDFGDGTTSTDKNPAHVYSTAGKYTVSLTVSNAGGTDTDEETNYITVIPSATSDFSASQTSGNAPLKVVFTDKSIGKPTAWNWNFGDGTHSSSQNPAHTYTKPGTYSASLSAYVGGVWLSTKSVTITVTELPVADFSLNPSSGYAPLLVQFTDKSTAATAWKWDFGDGVTSTAQNPAHTYAKEGNYTVTLKASNANGETSKTATVTVIPKVLPVADFSFNPASGNAPLFVQFTDKSSGEPTSWLWNFGDGATSTDKNPAHTYSSAGTYTITLKITNAFGSDTVEDYITVNAPAPKLAADFSANIKSAPLTAVFTDKSTGSPTKWVWNFGDGTSTRNAQNPTHKYSKAGTYTVKLTVTDATGATVSKSAKVTVYAIPSAAFSAKPTSGKAPLKVAFKDKSTGSPTSWRWSSKDFTKSNSYVFKSR